MGAAGGALGHAGGVGHVVPQVQVGAPADQVAVVELHLGGEDLRAAGQNRPLAASLALELTAQDVPGEDTHTHTTSHTHNIRTHTHTITHTHTPSYT